MARERSPNRDKAFELYKKHNGDIKLIDIAEQLGVSDVQVRKWKSQDKWEDSLKGTLPKKSKSTLPKDKSNVTNKKVTEKELNIDKEIEKLDNSNLTEKQKLFCIYYIKCFNATKAAIRAGYSKDTAMEQGSRLLSNVKIETEIKRLKADKFKGAFLSKEDLLQKYIDIAFADITDFMEFGQEEIEATNPETGEKITYIRNHVYFKNDYEVDGTMISEIKHGKDGVSLKLIEKKWAMDFLAKNIGLLDIETQQKLQIEKEKLEIAKLKSDKDNQEDKPIEIVIRRKGEGK